MGVFSRVFGAVALSFVSFISVAQSISVTDGYVREVIPGNSITSAYMTITNNGQQDVKLVGATSADVPRIEIHEHVMADGMMKMRQKSHIDIASGEQAVLKPMGLHLMMFDLNEPLKEGQEISLTLTFEGNQTHSVVLPVRSIKKAKTHHHHH